jgi:hypothetical protein
LFERRHKRYSRCPVRRDEQFAALGDDIPTNLLAVAFEVRE